MSLVLDWTVFPLKDRVHNLGVLLGTGLLLDEQEAAVG